MRVHSMICFLLIAAFSAGNAAAENLKKSYCAATLPGTFVKYEYTSKMPDGTTGIYITTDIRLADNAGRAAMEDDFVVKSGVGAGTVIKSLRVMEKGFDMSKDCLEYLSFLEYSIHQQDNGEAMLETQEMVDIYKAVAPSYRDAVTFKGIETMAGRQCDHYSYMMRTRESDPTIFEGEIWLDATVPFGIVKKTTTTKDASGKIRSVGEDRLVDSGKGASGTAAMIALIPAPGRKPSSGAAGKEGSAISTQPVSLEKAYQSGTILLSFAVVQGSGGKRLLMTVASGTSQAMTVIIPKGNLSLASDMPVETLNISIDKEQSISLATGAKAPPIEVKQTGKRGIISGNFEISMYEGQPFFNGEVEVGPLKE